MSDRTFVYIRDIIQAGGIENHFYYAFKRLKEDGFPRILIHDFKYTIGDSYKCELENSGVCRFDLNSNYKKFFLDYVKTNNVSDITFITATVKDYARAEYLKMGLSKEVRADSFYYVPNFKGIDYYYEDVFHGWLKKKVQKRMALVFNRISNNNGIRYFSKSFYDEMHNRYNVIVDDISRAMVPVVFNFSKYDENKRKEVYHSEWFNLLTVSRLDFPHKGFILGIIKAYGRLKKKYPQLKYTIVGDGWSIDKIKEEISKLDKKSQKDIILVGKCSFEDLMTYYDNSNLNISVAGCCSHGARRGLVSIPARHYNYDGEVYGYLPGSKDLMVSDIPGEPAEKYIEEVLNMSEEKYLKKCKESYDACVDINVSSSIFDRNKASINTMSLLEIEHLFLLSVIVKILFFIQQRISILAKDPFYYLKKIKKNAVCKQI